jgi:hypothetical protein
LLRLIEARDLRGAIAQTGLLLLAVAWWFWTVTHFAPNILFSNSGVTMK